jgi:hypothetical protein
MHVTGLFDFTYAVRNRATCDSSSDVIAVAGKRIASFKLLFKSLWSVASTRSVLARIQLL